jgi:hypothetical protein
MNYFRSTFRLRPSPSFPPPEHPLPSRPCVWPRGDARIVGIQSPQRRRLPAWTDQAAAASYRAASRAGAYAQDRADRRRNPFSRASCVIACAKGNPRKSSLRDREGLFQAHTLLQCAPANTSPYERTCDSECGPRRRGNARDNPLSPCGIVHCLFLRVKAGIHYV